MKINEYIEKNRPFVDAVEWLKTIKSGEMVDAWKKCPRGEWLLCAYERTKNIDKSLMTLAACACAKRVIPIYEREYPKDDRPRKAIKASERWANDPTEENDAASDAARAAARAAASDAARAAASDAARAAARAAAWAAAWDAAWDAASDAARAAARAAAMKKESLAQAREIRKIIPNPFEEKKA